MTGWSLRSCSGGRASVALLLASGCAFAAPTVEREVIGSSPNGTPIEVFTLAERDADLPHPGDRPAVVVISGVQGHHQIGVRVAESMAQLLMDEHGEALEGRTVYILPRLNPEGLARFASDREPVALSGRAPEARDADRDRRVDEDPPNDLDGDGFITMMRVPAPNPAYGLGPTHVIDADDPRIVREPEGDERATHALLIEGVDDDNDGRFNEDGWGGASGGGVDLDMHFPTHWPEHTDGAGLFPLERPEALSVVRWLQSRTNVAAVIVLGPHDTVVSIPAKGRYGPDGRVPRGIEEGDASVYEMASEAFKEATGVTKTEAGPALDGSLVQWCYADLGVYAFGNPVWVRPDLVKSDEPDDVAENTDETEDEGPTPEEIEVADRADLAQRGVDPMFVDFLYMTAEERMGVLADMQSMSETDLAGMTERFEALPDDVRGRLTALQGGGQDPGPRAEVLASFGGDEEATQAPAKTGDSADAKWLAWIDENADGGFVEWQAFDHPQLGEIEIGGFVPGVRTNPPAEAEAKLAAQQAAFAASVLGMLPELEINEPTVEAVGGGLWRIAVSMSNTGVLPTKSAIGLKTRRLPGLVCVLDPDQKIEGTRIVSGTRSVRVASIDGRGASARAEWLVVAEAGETLSVEVRSPMFGVERFELTMEDR